MSEQTNLTPDEARDLVSKLNRLAAELSPAQLGFLQSTLAAGAESSDVEGHSLPRDPLYTVLCLTLGCITIHI